MEQRMRATKDVKPKVRVERFDDDSRREGRKVERVGLMVPFVADDRDWKVAWTKSWITMRMRISKMTRIITPFIVMKKKKRMQRYKR